MDDFLVMEVRGGEGEAGPGRLGVALDYVCTRAADAGSRHFGKTRIWRCGRYYREIAF